VTVTDSNNVAICLFLPARHRGVLHSDQEAGSGWRGFPGEYGLLLAAELRLVTFSRAILLHFCVRRQFKLHAALLARRALQLHPASPLLALSTVKSVRSKFRSTMTDDQLHRLFYFTKPFTFTTTYTLVLSLLWHLQGVLTPNYKTNRNMIYYSFKTAPSLCSPNAHQQLSYTHKSIFVLLKFSRKPLNRVKVELQIYNF